MATDKGDQKQKIMIIATVFVMIIVVWQGVKLIGGGGSSQPAMTPANANRPATTTGTMGQQPGAGAAMATAQQPGQPGAAAAPVENQTPKQVAVPMNAEILKIQQETQAKYINALNELQMLKVQRDIAETKQAITSSILANATAEKSITDLLTVQQMPTQPQYLAPPTAEASAAPTAAPVAPVPMPKLSSSPEINYGVSSVYFKGDRWVAVLTYQDKAFTVSVGDTLPVDNSVVTAIDKNGVTLSKDRALRKLLISAAF